MGITISVKMKGALDLVQAMKQRMADLTVPLTVEATTLDALLQRGFAKSTSPMGERWQPLAPATIARRRRGSSKPLIDTGLLRSSVTTRATKDALMVGVSGAASQYAFKHQFGHDNITARPFLPVGKDGKPDLSRGPAKKWADGVRRRLEHYVRTGQVGG